MCIKCFRVEAGITDPVTRQGKADEELHDVVVSTVRTKVRKAAADFHRSGYWVEIFDDATGELLAGPYDPDQLAPAFVL